MLCNHKSNEVRASFPLDYLFQFQNNPIRKFAVLDKIVIRPKQTWTRHKLGKFHKIIKLSIQSNMDK